MPCAHASGVEPAFPAPVVPTVALPPPSALSPAAECTGSVTWQSRAPAWGASREGSKTPSGSNSEGRGRRRKPALPSPGVDGCPLVLQGDCGDRLLCGTHLASMAGCLGLSRETATKRLQFVHFQYQDSAWGRGLAPHVMRGGHLHAAGGRSGRQGEELLSFIQREFRRQWSAAAREPLG